MSSASEYSDAESIDVDIISRDLNIINEGEEAYRLYKKICKNYALEGNKMEWYACALYTVCRKCTTQTVGKQTKIEGNLVSLTNILCACEISLIRFFSKMKNWIQMENIPSEMKSKLDQLEIQFNVTTVIFKKYRPIFEFVFQNPSPVSLRFENTKNRKQYRKQPLTCHDVFVFCWNLFIYVKSRYSQISLGLVNSYHLLLVCLDYCFASVIPLENYASIINTNFYEMLTEKFDGDPRSLNNDNRLSIIDSLCSNFPGIVIEVKHIKKHWFKPHLNELIEKGSLRKRSNGIIEVETVDFNFKFIKREYENYVLNFGDFDESVFLREDAIDILGISDFQGEQKLEEAFQFHYQRSNHDQPNNLMPMTPLSCKQYFECRTPSKATPLTPISSATNSISRLQSIVVGRKNAPSENLMIMFRNVENDPLKRITEMVKKMGEIFVEATLSNYANSENSNARYALINQNEFIQNRLILAETFFYHILERLLTSESRQRIPEAQLPQTLSKLVQTEVFLRSLFVCSLEIVRYSYNLSTDAFPWILSIFDSSEYKIHPFHFYKVIELIIRDERSLSTDVVKHLNRVEERILEQLAWTKDSQVWVLLGKNRAPTSLEVSLNFFSINSLENAPSVMNSPVIKSSFKNINNDCKLPKRQLFASSEPANGDAAKNTIQGSVVKSENEDSCGSLVIPRQPPPPSIMNSPLPNGEGQKFGPLGLFFRKVYSLASLRLRDLCRRLKIEAEDLQLKIWTLLENVLNTHTSLMCDHHLDQIIMCSIFCICKINLVGDKAITFQDILHHYRSQPQAVSQVYRNVLIPENRQGDSQARNNYTIIDFYNKVFILEMSESYILQFSSREKKSPPLSPMPSSKSPVINSPLRQVSNYPVFVSPLRSASILFSPRRRTCVFQNNLNPSEGLKAINNMMTKTSANLDRKASIATAFVLSQNRVSKRILQDDQDPNDSPSKSLCSMNRKVLAILNDRQQIMSASSSANASATEDSNDSIQMNNNGNLGANITNNIQPIPNLTSPIPVLGSGNSINETNSINIPLVSSKAQTVEE